MNNPKSSKAGVLWLIGTIDTGLAHNNQIKLTSFEMCRTMDPGYVKRQLQAFLTLYEAGHVFRDYLPVYWSPSSRTALAEAELEYNPSHESTSVYVSLPLTSTSHPLSGLMEEHGETEVSCLVWTTTPWSLVANRAVCYHPTLSYSLLRSPSSPGLHLVATALLSSTGVQAALPASVEVARWYY